MIDFGLLLSMIAAIGVPTLAQRYWPLRTAEGGSFADLAAIGALVGLIVGRLAAVAFDSPGSFGRIGDLLIIRSGVDFWPGALATVLVLWFEARHRDVGLVDRLADLAPLGLLGYAAYEACCVVRDGCFGPVASIGLRPPGVSTTMVPTGLLVAAVIVVVAFVLRARQQAGASSALVVVAAVAGVAGVRSLASFWLPHVGEGLTRPHLTSIVIAVLSAPLLVALVVRQRRVDAADAPASRTS